MLALLEADWERAVDCFDRGIGLLVQVRSAEPLEFRALWPLLLARAGEPRAETALAAADRSDLTIAFANRGLLGYAGAVLAGHCGDPARARELALSADAYLARFPVWADIARLCAADAAAADGWGDPRRWLTGAPERFAQHGLDALARHCRGYLRASEALTRRERDVLDLLAEGLPYKQIGDRLHLSPRTVEKHVETLKRKTGQNSRTLLVLWARERETP